MRIKNLAKPSLNWLLAFVPVAALLQYVPDQPNQVAVFACASLAIVPLAGLMGRATEALAERLGQGVGGLLNASFGNAAELIIGIMALRKGLVHVVKASITGSIIGNLLLVLGMSMLAGGARHSTQKFNKTAVRALMSSLSLAAIGLLAPTIFHITSDARPGGWERTTELRLSFAIAVALMVTYVGSLLFSLKTHAEIFSSKNENPEGEQSGWSKTRAGLTLAVATILVTWMSELLVGSVESARRALGLTEVFVGVIVVAVIGNAAEHSTAVLTAWRDKMDLSLAIAIGSSQQVALFVAPALFFISYAFGHPITLEFSLPEIVSVFAAVYVVAQISGDGESNWLEGLQLVSVYVILALLFYFLPERGAIDGRSRAVSP